MGLADPRVQVDPEGGYTAENCRLVCALYNLAKSDWAHEDVVRMARALVAMEGAIALEA